MRAIQAQENGWLQSLITKTVIIMMDFDFDFDIEEVKETIHNLSHEEKIAYLSELEDEFDNFTSTSSHPFGSNANGMLTNIISRTFLPLRNTMARTWC